jgi:predicted ester cyclase
MTRDEVRDLVDAWARSVGALDEAALERLTSPALREGVLARSRGVRAAFADVEVVPLQVVIEGDSVAWRWRLSGRHVGPIAGIAPSGEPVSVEGVNFQRIGEGRVVEHWTTVDLAPLARKAASPPAK